VRVTNYKTGSTGQPALWVTANIHATEVAGSMACRTCCIADHGYGRMPENHALPDTRAF